MDDFLKTIDDGKEFRLQNKKIHLTYKSHIPPEAWLSWLSKVKDIKIESYSIVHEKGNILTPYDHTHILINFGYTFQTRNSRYFDWKNPITGENIHPNIKIVKTANHWKNVIVYHYKEGIPHTNIPKPELKKKTLYKKSGNTILYQALC